MLTRPSFTFTGDSPLVDSPYCQQDDFGYAVPPGPDNDFLLLDGQPLMLLDGTHFLLLGS